MSLNHQKKIAALALSDYKVVDNFRRNAKKAIDSLSVKERKAKLSGTIRFEERLREAERELSLLREDLLLLQRAYDIRCAQARRYANAAGDKLLTICNKEQREIDATLSAIRNRRSNSGVTIGYKR
ncbi:hypothetical protein ACQQ2N_06875 [Dokdonella sp. MW10]|uniref:hypothetical protein n=1 Tax=Dokdonella sp. MW10 TaxID=2992926 RepID=UPI003F8025E5